MIDVVIIAAIVPRGILRLGSRKSPLRLDPAMMPAKKKKKILSFVSILKGLDFLPVTDGK